MKSKKKEKQNELHLADKWEFSWLLRNFILKDRKFLLNLRSFHATTFTYKLQFYRFSSLTLIASSGFKYLLVRSRRNDNQHEFAYSQSFKHQDFLFGGWNMFHVKCTWICIRFMLVNCVHMFNHPSSISSPTTQYHCLWKIVFRTIITSTSTAYRTAWIHKHQVYSEYIHFSHERNEMFFFWLSLMMSSHLVFVSRRLRVRVVERWIWSKRKHKKGSVCFHLFSLGPMAGHVSDEGVLLMLIKIIR